MIGRSWLERDPPLPDSTTHPCPGCCGCRK